MAAAAAADSVKRIKAEATCSICLDLFRDPVTTECGHSFCELCISRHCQGCVVFTCPQCRHWLQKGNVNENRELKNIVEFLKSQTVEKRAGGFICERHGEPLKLYCNKDQRPICVVCMQSRDHRGHPVVPKEEAVQEYREKMAEQLGVIESSCGKLHQFVKQVWEHLPENEQEEEYRSMKRVCEKLTTVLQVHTGTPRQRSGEPPSQPLESSSPARDVPKDTELEGHSAGGEPSSEREHGRKQASLDPDIHKISNTREAEEFKESIRQQLEGIESECEKLNQLVSTDQMDLPENAREDARQSVKRLTDNVATLLKVAEKKTRKRPKEGSSTTPAEGSGGSSSDGSSVSSEEEGAALGSESKAAGGDQQHPRKKRKHNEN